MNFYGQDEWTGSGGSAQGFSPCFKRKNRWKFKIKDVSGDGVQSLPPFRGGKPALSFKEMQAEHLNETIFFPVKPEWKPITLTLYDIVKEGENPVFTWIRRAYDPKNCSLWNPCLEESNPIGPIKVAACYLQLYDGCGEVIEEWTIEHAWPQNVEFAEGDMSNGDLITCDLTLRYDRAYISIPTDFMQNEMETTLSGFDCGSVPISSISLSMMDTHPEPEAEFVVVRSSDQVKFWG